MAAHRRCLTEAEDGSAATGPEDTAAREGLAEHTARARIEDSAIVQRTRERYEQVHQLKAQGKGIKPIMRELGLAKGTVRRFFYADSVDELLAVARSGRPSKIDEFKDHLHQPSNIGCTNVRLLHEETTRLGFAGSHSILRDYLHPFRELAAAPVPKVRELTAWIMTYPDALDAQDGVRLKEALAQCPHMRAAAELVASFAQMMTGLHGDRLDGWIEQARADPLAGLGSLACELVRDYEAVHNAMSLPHIEPESVGSCGVTGT